LPLNSSKECLFPSLPAKLNAGAFWPLRLFITPPLP
jgi:hypothetical protein